MKERPILFSGAMVRAILGGHKTQTRRVIKAQGVETDDATGKALFVHHPNCPNFCDYACGGSCVERGVQTWEWAPYGMPGERLWVRETWTSGYQDGAWGTICKADSAFLYGKRKHDKGPHFHAKEIGPHIRWRPSIFMPRWASRITLEIVTVRVERLQEISEQDAIAEGCAKQTVTEQDVSDILISDASPEVKALAKAFGAGAFTARFDYLQLWDSINGKKHPWASNPWVWVVEFTKATTESKSLEVGTCAIASTESQTPM